MSSPASRTSGTAFDRLPFGSGRLGVDEVGRRQEEWEKEIETLDQKEMELHQSQLRLIREQTAIFIRDLAVLQGEVSALKDNVGIGISANIAPLQSDIKEQKAKLASQEQLFASAQKRIDYLERTLGESVERHSHDLESAKSAHARLADEAKAREAHHASVAERLNYIEQLVGDSFEKHSREIQSSHTRLETMHSRLMAYETDTTQNSLRDRVDFLEKLMGESADKHSQGLQAAHSKFEDLHGNLQEQMSTRMERLHGSIQERLERLEKQFGQADDRRAKETEARLAFLEQQFGGSLETHARELKHVKSQVEEAHQKLGNHHSSLQHHATLGDRVDYLEKLMGDSADKHTNELGQAHTKLDQLRGRLTALEAVGVTVESMKQNHSVLMAEKAKRDAHHASISERVDYIEKQLGDSADQHSQDLKAAHAKLDQLHGRLASCEAHGSHIDGMRKAHEKLATDQASRDSYHATLAQRMEYLEKIVGDSVEHHKKELQATKMAQDQLHSRLHEEKQLREQVGKTQHGTRWTWSPSCNHGGEIAKTGTCHWRASRQ
eukprot:symbB.v1.2.002762.t1/scaffold141.1/size300911/13